ncbi:MAG: polyisoprenyl-teichoic acid--peptidoglycan teichoic acid transferase [Solirubrobacteraceae bacterium]|nr:polyisoprenyl-teichoic acid--peptidoglycan teichoic acid transferase [Solirubrobacteraceae bacterium]
MSVPADAGPERPPRVAWGLYKRLVIGGTLIILLTAASVSTAALLQVKHVGDIINRYQPHVAFKPGTITKAEAGKPQTILLVGSDRRYGAGKGDARSDTLMLVRLDPGQQATAVLSIPRDLVVDVPGHGRTKINAAYSYGGLDLTVRTVKQLLSASGTPFKINHAVGVNFSGFRQAVDFLGCVYVDVDRRYYHSNLGLPPSQQYAEIDVQPGYQRLCGQKALDYVRFRHQDNDLVRAARQQDFLRAAKDQVSTSRLLGNLDSLVTIFAKSTEADSNLGSSTGILRLLKLAAFSTGHPVRQIQFPATFVQSAPTTTAPGLQASAPATGLGDYVTASQESLARIVDQFLHAKAETTARKKASRSARRTAKQTSPKRGTAQPGDYGLVDARRTGEDLVATTVASGRLKGLPLYFPAWLTGNGRYPQSTGTARMPYVYTLRDRAGKPHAAYRLVVLENLDEGQYYGVQGTTWRAPPILTKGTDTVRMAGRTYKVAYDGSRIRTVAWRTPRGVYWVSNSLLGRLTNRQMLGVARSLTRFR